MLNTSGPALPGREQLSALMDGQLEPQALVQAMAAWRDDPDLAASWYSYHLVADVMRSDELAVPPQRDRAFLASLRTRLAAEPVPLATTPLYPATAPDAQGAGPARVLSAVTPVLPQRGRWLRRGMMAPLAVAAGFVAVAGVLVVFRTSLPLGADGAQMAAVSVPSGVQAVSGLTVVRDVQLDRYLNAHRKQVNGFNAPGADSQQVRIVYERQ